MASYKQFAALPFRVRGSRIDVLLITTRRKRRWSIPKGWPIDAAKPHRTAEIEAWEEAGLVGRVKPKDVGRYTHRKARRKRKVLCHIRVFPLKVRKQMKRWPERGQRDMIWLPASQAAARVHKAEIARLIERFARRRSLKLKPGRKPARHGPAGRGSPRV